MPYVKYAATKQLSSADHPLEITATEIDVILEGIEAEIEKKNEERETQVVGKDPKRNQLSNQRAPESESDCVEITDSIEEVLTEDDQILKKYFENMLQSTLKLPRFHQNRIKQHLQACVNEQKALNKNN